MRKIILCNFFILLIAVFSSSAFSTPHDELKKTKEEISKAGIYVKELADKSKDLSAKLASLSKKMVETAKELQASEAKLSSIEEKLGILAAQINEKTESLTLRKKELAAAIQAAVRLSQTPKEAVILMPGDMMNNMKASKALKITTDSIKTEAGIINIQMKELKKLKEKVEENQEEAARENKLLEEKRKKLNEQIKEHKQIQQKLNAEQKATKEKIRALSRKAEDLQQLISVLEKEQEEKRKKEEELRVKSGIPQGERGKLRSFSAAKGHIRVPAAGRLSQKYGAAGYNRTSKGIIIKTRENAQVTTPFDAEVIFTGPFMEYGRMVILRHSDGFHTLLAGINEIDVYVGSFLLEGEPIGSMGNGENNRLYMEIRHNNQPVNPAGWVYGIK